MRHQWREVRRRRGEGYGKMWPYLAELARKERRRFHVCNNVNVSPFGMRNMINMVEIWRLMCGVVMKM